MQTAARATGQKIIIVSAYNDAELDAAFASFARERAGALLVADDPLFTARRNPTRDRSKEAAGPFRHDSAQLALVQHVGW